MDTTKCSIKIYDKEGTIKSTYTAPGSGATTGRGGTSRNNNTSNFWERIKEFDGIGGGPIVDELHLLRAEINKSMINEFAENKHSDNEIHIMITMDTHSSIDPDTNYKVHRKKSPDDELPPHYWHPRATPTCQKTWQDDDKEESKLFSVKELLLQDNNLQACEDFFVCVREVGDAEAVGAVGAIKHLKVVQITRGIVTTSATGPADQTLDLPCTAQAAVFLPHISSLEGKKESLLELIEEKNNAKNGILRIELSELQPQGTEGVENKLINYKFVTDNFDSTMKLIVGWILFNGKAYYILIEHPNNAPLHTCLSKLISDITRSVLHFFKEISKVNPKINITFYNATCQNTTGPTMNSVDFNSLCLTSAYRGNEVRKWVRENIYAKHQTKKQRREVPIEEYWKQSDEHNEEPQTKKLRREVGQKEEPIEEYWKQSDVSLSPKRLEKEPDESKADESLPAFHQRGDLRRRESGSVAILPSGNEEWHSNRGKDNNWTTAQPIVLLFNIFNNRKLSQLAPGEHDCFYKATTIKIRNLKKPPETIWTVNNTSEKVQVTLSQHQINICNDQAGYLSTYYTSLNPNNQTQLWVFKNFKKSNAAQIEELKKSEQNWTFLNKYTVGSKVVVIKLFDVIKKRKQDLESQMNGGYSFSSNKIKTRRAKRTKLAKRTRRAKRTKRAKHLRKTRKKNKKHFNKRSNKLII